MAAAAPQCGAQQGSTALPTATEDAAQQGLSNAASAYRLASADRCFEGGCLAGKLWSLDLALGDDILLVLGSHQGIAIGLAHDAMRIMRASAGFRAR